jgi:Tfp pilus assembly protein PilP
MQAALVLVGVLALAAGCSADCDSDVQEYMDGLATLKLWAMQSL